MYTKTRKVTLFSTYQNGVPVLSLCKDKLSTKTSYGSTRPESGNCSGGRCQGRAIAARSAYVLIDVRTASVTSLLAAPGGGQYAGTQRAMPASTVYWSHDGTRAIIVNVTLNRQAEKARERQEASEEAIVEYNVSLGRWRFWSR